MLDTSRAPERRPRPSRGSSTSTKAAPAAYRGPYGSAGPYEDEEGRYEIRLEKVPGGLRLADWGGGSIRRRAPALAAGDLGPLILGASERGVLSERDADALRAALAEAPQEGAQGGAATSGGRAGDLRDELRVERLEDERIRVARWVMRPGSGWELQEAPVMLPAARYAEALGKAARSGLLVP